MRRNIVRSFIKDREGASLVEYSVLLGLMTVGSVVLVGAVGTKVTTAWSGLNSAWSVAGPGSLSSGDNGCSDCAAADDPGETQVTE